MKSAPSNAFRFLAPSFLLLLGLTSGCGTLVTVDSLVKPGAKSISYELRNTNPELESDSLRYKEGADYVRTALSARGIFEAPPGVKPDVIVSVEFDISPPQIRREKVLEPITKTVKGQPHYVLEAVGTDANGNIVNRMVTVYGPDQEVITGYRDAFITSTVYEKHLKMVAHEASPSAESGPAREIWLVDVTSEGESRDLRKQLPLLVAASIDFIGEDSKGQKNIRIKDQDADVRFIKKGMPSVAALPK
jgi:hypothetical protein